MAIIPALTLVLYTLFLLSSARPLKEAEKFTTAGFTLSHSSGIVSIFAELSPDPVGALYKRTPVNTHNDDSGSWKEGVVLPR